MKNKRSFFARALSIFLIALFLLPSIGGINLAIHVSAVTTNQQHMVDRADYMYNITWVCQKTVSGWKSNYTFTKGETYRIPYAWPVTAGKWIPYGVSVEDFLAATTDPASDFYTKQSYYTGNTGSYSTYYGNDCSTFVSFCWGLSTRQTTTTLPNVSTKIGGVTTSNVNNLLQLGDALDDTGSHVVLVTDIVYNAAGAITSIEITEQTPPQIKRSTYTVSGLVSKYGANYDIYRYTGTVAAAPEAPVTPSVTINPDNYTVPTSDIQYVQGSMPTGSEVYWVQAVLHNLGYTLDVDGKFGSGSAGVVAQFQSDFGLTSNGVVNAETRAMLIKCWTNNRGYYTVTANTSLTIRNGDGTSYDKLGTAPGGAEMAVIGFNADKSWANVIYNGIVGWSSMSYLAFNRFFNYSISYNPNESTASGTMPTATQKAYSQYTVLGSDVTATGKNLTGWWLFRTSDQSWYVDGTGWVADANIGSYTRKLFVPGDKFSIDETLLNMSAAEDGYILFGVWENKEIPLGVYKVTATNLNMRDASNASGNIVTVLNNADEVQVIGYNEAKTWVNIIFGQYKGWVNVKYLSYVRDFEYTVSYVTGNSAAAPASVKLSKGGSTTVQSTSTEGFELEGWTVQRASDGAWWNASGWTTNASAKSIVTAGTTFYANEANINAAAGDETYTFTGVWNEVNTILYGDVNGDGNLNSRDSLLLRRYLGSLVSLDQLNFENSDIDGDGKINSRDSLALRLLLASGQ